MTLHGLSEFLTAFAGFVTALLALGGAVAALLKKRLRGAQDTWKKLGEMLDDWRGEPARPGFPARPGVPERLEKVEAEVKANGGKSIKDVLTRVEKKLDTHIDETTGDGH